jgi:hypothetical protein
MELDELIVCSDYITVHCPLTPQTNKLFDADKFVALFRSIVSKLGITTLNTVFELVDNYDGVLVGFEMKKN